MVKKFFGPILALAFLLTVIQVHAAPIIFDDFDGTSLNKSLWTVLNEDPGNYSVSGSKLNTYTLQGDLWGPYNSAKNVFLVHNPLGTGNFQITMKVLDFNPVQYHQQVAILAYDNNDNYVKCANGFLLVVPGGARAWEFGREINQSYNATLSQTDAANANFYLRLVKAGKSYMQYYSLDGSTFKKINQTLTYGNGAPNYLGFVAFQGAEETQPPVPVSIDFFKVEAVDFTTPCLTPLLQD